MQLGLTIERRKRARGRRGRRRRGSTDRRPRCPIPRPPSLPSHEQRGRGGSAQLRHAKQSNLPSSVSIFRSNRRRFYCDVGGRLSSRKCSFAHSLNCPRRAATAANVCRRLFHRCQLGVMREGPTSTYFPWKPSPSPK